MSNKVTITLRLQTRNPNNHVSGLFYTTPLLMQFGTRDRVQIEIAMVTREKMLVAFSETNDEQIISMLLELSVCSSTLESVELLR